MPTNDVTTFPESAKQPAAYIVDFTEYLARAYRRERFERQYAKQRANHMRRVKKGRR